MQGLYIFFIRFIALGNYERKMRFEGLTKLLLKIKVLWDLRRVVR